MSVIGAPPAEPPATPPDESAAFMSWRRTGAPIVVPIVALVAVVAPVIWIMASRPGAFDATTLVVWWTIVAIFAALHLTHRTLLTSLRARVLSLVALSTLALAANWLVPMATPGVALTGILLALVAGHLVALPRAVAVTWIVVQSLALLAIYLVEWPAPIAVGAGFAYAALQLMVHSAAEMTERERRRSVDLESMVRELESTRNLLDESVRATERAQIARDLHDVVGHHLVALGLQLDAAMATRAATGRPSVDEHLAQARQLVRLLLADIREVVAEMRTGDGVDIRGALRGLATTGPGPRVTVEIDDVLPPLSGELGLTLLRAAQEAITNARKHAGARLVRVEIDAERLRIDDDGAGTAARRASFDGTGLAGMAERCAATGCILTVDSDPRRGTTVTIALPSALKSTRPTARPAPQENSV